MVIEPLDVNVHNRLGFQCGNEQLDRFLHEHAQQAKRKGLAATFVAVAPGNPHKILGYYSLSQFMITGTEIPAALRKKRRLPEHQVGAALLGKLAVSADQQRKGIGEMLVVNALQRAYRCAQDVSGVCVVVDAIDEQRVAFYERLGFARLDPQSLRLVIMMDTIAELMRGEARPADAGEIRIDAAS